MSDEHEGHEANHPKHGGHGVRIHINQKKLESISPTTGEALYLLANVAAGHVLYREVEGDREDEPIRKDAKHVHLSVDEHFHSGEPKRKEFRIVVNGRPKEWAEEQIAFEQLIGLAYDAPPAGANVIITVTYHKGPGHTPDGTLVAMASVGVKNGMVFNVIATDKS